MNKGASIVGNAVKQRMFGQRPGMVQALAAATVAGVTTAVLTYKLLRSGSD